MEEQFLECANIFFPDLAHMTESVGVCGLIANSFFSMLTFSLEAGILMAVKYSHLRIQEPDELP